MKNIFLIGLLSLLLTSCGEKICDCFDQVADAIYFSFDTGNSAQSFTIAEIDTFYMYQLAKNQHNVLDTAMFFYDPARQSFVTREGTAGCGFGKGFVLNQGCTFYQPQFQEFDYQIDIPGIKTFRVNNFEITGVKGNGDCSCYHNTSKKFAVNGQSYDLTGKEPQQNAIVLTK